MDMANGARWPQTGTAEFVSNEQGGTSGPGVSANMKASQLDHAMHVAHTWVNALTREFDTDDREFAYAVLRAWLHTLRDRLTVEAVAHFAALT